jgi:hypothetical protein
LIQKVNAFSDDQIEKSENIKEEFMTLQKESILKRDMKSKRRTCSTGHTTNFAIDK